MSFYSRLSEDRVNYHQYEIPEASIIGSESVSATSTSPQPPSTVGAVVHASMIRAEANIDKIIELLGINPIIEFIALTPLGKGGNDGDIFSIVDKNQKKFAVKRYKSGLNTAVLPFLQTLRTTDPAQFTPSERAAFSLVTRAAIPVAWFQVQSSKALVFQWFTDRERRIDRNDLSHIRAQIDMIHKLGYCHLDVTKRNIMLLKSEAVLVDYDCVCAIGHVAMGPLPPESSRNVIKREPVEVEDDEHLWEILEHAVRFDEQKSISSETKSSSSASQPASVYAAPSRPPPQSLSQGPAYHNALPQLAARETSLRKYLADTLPDLCGLIGPLTHVISDYAEVPYFLSGTPDILLSADSSTATKTDDDDCRTLIVAPALQPRGTQRIRFKFSEARPDTWVGLVPHNKDRLTAVGSSEGQGWGYFSSSGSKDHNGEYLFYGSYWDDGTGPEVVLEVDFEKDTLGFVLNGVFQGVAFSELSLWSLGPLYPAATLSYAQQSVTVDRLY